MSKPRRGQSIAVDLAGADAAIRGHAQQAIATEVLPAEDASPEAWATYCNAARGRWAAATIEWGKRISLAHAAYSAKPQRWGRTWGDWCEQNLGIGKRYADQLRLIGSNLGVTNSHILPAATDQLHTLAKVRRDNPQAFDSAVEAGVIHPQLTRAEAQQLLRSAQAETVPVRPEEHQNDILEARIRFQGASATKLTALASARGQTPKQLLELIVENWLKRQPMPDGTVTIDATAQLTE